MLKIRRVHILVRHLFNQKDHSAGIFFKEKDGGIDWLWTAIEETVVYIIMTPKNLAREVENSLSMVSREELC